MMLNLHVRGVEESTHLRSLISRRLESAFDHLSPEPATVSVLLEDVNGPKGGDDKHCRLVMQFPKKVRVVIDETGNDLLATFQKAADRAAASATRVCEKTFRRE